MGWAVGYDTRWNRDIGYGVPAYCDEPECNEVIDRGLAYVCCNEEPYGGDEGCGLYFCSKHLYLDRCRHEGYQAKPDHPDWVHHNATDPSWEGWRMKQESA
jgi:hypothetical protein